MILRFSRDIQIALPAERRRPRLAMCPTLHSMYVFTPQCPGEKQRGATVASWVIVIGV